MYIKRGEHNQKIDYAHLNSWNLSEELFYVT